MKKWYLHETNNSNIISSRIRLARNLNKYPFSIKLNDEDASRMISETTSAIKDKTDVFGDYLKFVDFNSLDALPRRAMLETHVISPEFLKKKGSKALLYSQDESLSIMLNEEDHIRIQAIFPEDNIEASWNLADKADNLIEESLEFAFDKDYGYLTSCPTNTGTGMRASFMLHLPMIEKMNQLKYLLNPIAKFGMTIRGIYGEGSESFGGIYQISNQITMGKTEHEIIAALKNITKQITETENALCTKMLNTCRIDIEDSVYRSLGILTSSRKIVAKEAMNLLSEVRLGYICGILKPKAEPVNIYNIMINIQPGNMQLRAQKALNEQEIAVYRAEYLRNTL